MRWTREDCSPVRLRNMHRGLRKRDRWKKRAKWRPQPAARKLPRRVCSSPHFPSPSAPAGVAEPAAELAAAAAAVVLVAEQAEPGAPAGQAAAEARAALEVQAEPGAVAEPEELADWWPRRHGNYGRWGWYEANGLQHPNNPLSQPRSIVPQLPVSAVPNQQILAALAEGTGGFTIFNTNDLLGGLQRIASEQNEFYLLGLRSGGFTGRKLPHVESEIESWWRKECAVAHGLLQRTLRKNVLEGTPVEKQLELRAPRYGAGRERPRRRRFLTLFGANVARVNLAMDIPAREFSLRQGQREISREPERAGHCVQTGWNGRREIQRSSETRLEKDEWKNFRRGRITI